MPIDPWLADRFESVRDIPSFQAALADPQHAAALAEFLRDPAPWTPPEGVTVESGIAEGPHGQVPLRIVRATASPPPRARCCGCTAAGS
ncbi:MAG: hypothetical protein R2717_01260 [Schumannella sp.]